MNATIQEIEGIDDYWGPAFRSVYEGEGHEAFVQQLDERIVQHDKEIEKLCNFHYQPTKRKRQRGHLRNAIESAGVSHESTEYLRSKNAHQLQSSSRKTKSHSTVAKKHHNITDEVASSYDVNKRKKPRLDPKRLGGYSNTFPKAGRTPRSHISGDAHNTQNHDASPRVNDSDDESFCYDGYTDGTPELDNEETWEVNSTKLSCEEYNDIAEYHALVKQKKNTTPMADKESDTTSDLRLYLRNRKPCRNSSAERYPDKNRLTPKPYRDQSYQSFPEQRGDRSHGTSAELPHHNKRDPSDQGITYHHNDGSRRHASSENIADRRSRYDAFDERYERHYGWSRHAPHNQRHHTFNDRHYDKRRYDSAECFQGERKSNERYRVQGQHYSVDRQYRESHSAASDRRDRHFDQRRRNSSERHIYDRGHESTRLQGDETSRNERYFGHRRHDSTERQHEYRQHEYRQHVSSRLQEKENSPSERHFGQRRYDSSERQNGDRRNVSVRLLVCDSRSERHFDQSRHDSPDYENSDRRHASTRFQDKENSPNERRFSQSRHDFTERQSGERRHESTIFHEKENRPNDRYIGQGHHDFAERKNGDECREIASYEVEERISKERQLDKRRHDSTERRNGDGCYANAISCQSKRTSHERQCIESPTGSTSPHIADVEPHFSNKAEYHDSPKTSIGLNTTNDLRCYLRSKTPKVDDNAAFERRYGSVHDSDPDEHHGRSHTSTDLQHNQIIGSATRYHNENPLDACHLTKSCRLSSEHHVAPTSGEPFELHQSQSCALSADFNHSQNRSVSAELSHSQSGALSAELHHTQSRALSADRHLGQNPPLSALSVELQYNQNRNLSAELHYRQGRDLCADQHSQNRQSQNRDASTQLCHSQSPLTSGLNHGQSRPLSAELHRSQCRTLSADHHFDDNCYVSAEPYCDERRLTVEHRPNDRLNNFTERQRNGENRPAELQTHTIDPDAKPEPIVVLTSSAECSRNRITDVTTQNAYEYTAECSNPVHADNLNDVRSKLYSHLKTKFTCHREACAAFFCDTSEPRTQSELRDDDCPESAIKSGSSQIYDSVRRQCNTPDPDVKTELNGNTVNDAVDSSAVSGIISTNHNFNQCLVKPVNQADGKCSPLAEKIVKDEPNDNPSDSVTSTLEMNNANHLVSKTSLLHSDNIVKGEPNNNSSDLVGSTLEMASANPRFLKSISAEHPSIQVKDFPKPMPLTVYSMRHPNHATRISLRADTVVETAQHNSFITESSGRTKTIDSDATLHNNNLVTFNVRQPSQYSPEANKQSTQESRPNSSNSSLPNAKERQFNISVRDVESINLSGTQLVTDTNGNICEEIPSHRDDFSTDMYVDDESRRLNTSSGGTGGSNSISADVVLTSDLGLQLRQNCSSVSCEKIQESNVIATASRDPRLQPTNNCVTTPQNDIVAKVASLPVFYPSNKNQNITAWINSVNEIAIACKWTDEQTVKIAMSKLGGNAKRWFEGFSSNLSWYEWQNKLKAAFPFEENYGKMLSDMLKKTAKTVDSLEDYWIEKMAMLDRCSIRGKKAVECIIFGIEDETVRSKAGAEKFNDPEKLLEFLRKQWRCDNMKL